MGHSIFIPVDEGTSLSSSAKGLAGRYAGALYALAEESGKIDAVVEDMNGIAELVSANQDMRMLVESPAITWAEQTKAVTAVLAKCGADALTVKFVGTVASNGRLHALTRIISAFLAEHARRAAAAADEDLVADGVLQVEEIAVEVNPQQIELGERRQRGVGLLRLGVARERAVEAIEHERDRQPVVVGIRVGVGLLARVLVILTHPLDELLRRPVRAKLVDVGVEERELRRGLVALGHAGRVRGHTRAGDVTHDVLRRHDLENREARGEVGGKVVAR